MAEDQQFGGTIKTMKHGRNKPRPSQAAGGSGTLNASGLHPAAAYAAGSKTVSRSKPAGGGSSVESIRFWGQFLDDPAAAKSNPKYHKFVWAGVPPEIDLRRQVWPSLTKAIQDVKTPNAEGKVKEVDEALVEEIRIELENDDVFRHLDSETGATTEAVEKLVKAVHLATDSVDRYIPGSVQLGALLLEVCDQNMNEAFKLLTALLKIMEDYMSDNYYLLRNECLVIADVFSREVQSLSERFNQCGFDVVDMTDLLCIWSAPLFVYHFPKEFVLRVLDLIFAEGPKILGNVIFAIIFVFQEELEMIKTTEAVPGAKEGEAGKKLYSTLYDIPTRITPLKIEKIFKVGYEMILNFPKMAELRQSKDWNHAIRSPGALKFKRGVGDKPPEGDEEKTGTGTFGLADLLKLGLSELKEQDDLVDMKTRGDLDAAEDEEEEEDRDVTEVLPVISLQEVQEGSDPNALYEKIKKLTEANNRFLRHLDSSKKELKDRAAKISQLEYEIQSLESRIRGASSQSPTMRLPGQANALSNFVADLRVLEVSGSSVSRFGEAKSPDDESKYHSFALHDTFIAYSNIYEKMDFPCVYMEGYLFKLTRTGMFNKLNLNRRWFVLKGRFLTYFKSHIHTKPQKDRCVDLKGCVVSPINKHPKGEFAFEVASKTHKFLLFANDQKEMYKWLIALRAAVV
eukprot:TRINITY_DN1453_c0_g1_i1.p1 TRINITY_DN1453_c0_g1~~TRINITY_DN1453_c0_g1_i1.p1  ORF type:complete len:713 (-),score=194.29 TRINITY_DN1453_c0_g1_i1:2375-4423(-)